VQTKSYSAAAVRSVRRRKLFALAEDRCNIAYELMLARIGTQHIGTAKVGFPLAKQRSKIKIHDVIRPDASIRRIVMIGEEGILTAPDDPLVPVTAHAKAIVGELMD